MAASSVAWKQQWRRQRSKGARSFRGQKILSQWGHPDALFSSKKVDDLYFSCPLITQVAKIKQIKWSDNL